jgi:hypothetical protein
LGPHCHHVDARTVRPAFASSRLLAAGTGEFAAQAPTAAAAFDENVSVASWKAKPSWYLVATADRAIQPSLERAMAKAINAKTVEIASSHVAMLARPEETANPILEAAGRASPSNVGLKSA